MIQPIRLTITVPSGEKPLVEYGRHFNVHGSIEVMGEIPDDAILTVRLLNSSGQVLRYARQKKE